MNEYEKNLKENYENMHEDILLNLKVQGGQTAEAQKLLDEELNRRGLTEKEIARLNLEAENEKINELNGLRGWLILVGIGIVFSPIRLGFTMVQTYAPIIKNGTWDKLTNIESPNYIPHFQSLMIGEVMFNLCMMLASIYLIYLFGSKSKKFPQFFIAISAISIISIPIDSFLATLVFDDMKMFDAETSKELIRSLLVFGVWVPYMLISKRVKNTFVY
jgi:hypothetical protein